MDMCKELTGMRDIAEDRLVQLTATQTQVSRLQVAGYFDASHCPAPQVRFFIAD